MVRIYEKRYTNTECLGVQWEEFMKKGIQILSSLRVQWEEYMKKVYKY